METFNKPVTYFITKLAFPFHKICHNYNSLTRSCYNIIKKLVDTYLKY